MRSFQPRGDEVPERRHATTTAREPAAALIRRVPAVQLAGAEQGEQQAERREQQPAPIMTV